MFLGFPKNATKHVVWYDPETNTVKIAKHARFDEGMNDTPTHRLPPDASQSHRLNSGEHFPAEEHPTDLENFMFHTEPFDKIITESKSTVQAQIGQQKCVAIVSAGRQTDQRIARGHRTLVRTRRLN